MYEYVYIEVGKLTKCNVHVYLPVEVCHLEEHLYMAEIGICKGDGEHFTSMLLTRNRYSHLGGGRERQANIYSRKVGRSG